MLPRAWNKIAGPFGRGLQVCGRVVVNSTSSVYEYRHRLRFQGGFELHAACPVSSSYLISGSFIWKNQRIMWGLVLSFSPPSPPKLCPFLPKH